MTTHNFFILAAVTWPTPEGFFDLADRLHDVCSDCSPSVIDGTTVIEFNRDAESLVDAVSTAVRDAARCGFDVQAVETGESRLVKELNARLVAGDLTTAAQLASA